MTKRPSVHIGRSVVHQTSCPFLVLMSQGRTEEQWKKIRMQLPAKEPGTYRMSPDEIENGVCENCGSTFWTLADGDKHTCVTAVELPGPVIALRVNREDIERRWVCMVLRSGYHNGSTCNPREPHGEWGCGYRTECHISLTDEQMKEWA